MATMTEDRAYRVAQERRSKGAGYDRAFEKYLRSGDVSPILIGQGIQHRDLTPIAAAGGGVLIGARALSKFYASLTAHSRLRSVCTVITTDHGEDLALPGADDTSREHAGIVTPNQSLPTASDPTIRAVVLKAYRFSSGDPVKWSWELAQDSSTDVEAVVVDLLTDGVNRGQNTHFTAGTGANSPTGIATAATIGVTGDSGSTTSVSYAALLDIEASVNSAYRTDAQGNVTARWMMRDATLTWIKKNVVDGSGRAVWLADVSGRTHGTLLGYPVTINDAMPAMAASAKSILFGDFARGVVIRDVGDVVVRVLTELFARNGQNGAICELRSDIAIADPNAIRAYAHSAS